MTRLRILILLGFILSALLIAALAWRFSKASVVEERTTFNQPSSSVEPSATPMQAASPSPEATPEASPSPSNAPSELMVQPTPSFEAPPSPTQTLAPSPSIQPTPVATPTQQASFDLLIPVAGVRPEQLQDTFTAARSAGRTHDAIDIPAPKGTPVLAVADGPIIKLFLSKPGGITIYQLAQDNRTIYYYAHLERYADGIAEGRFARRGETIAYVGDTGNAGPGNYHLHFSISLVKDPKRWWEGVNINPYPLLRANRN